MPRIYTRTGDGGETGLLGGRRVPKDDLRVDAYVTVDLPGDTSAAALAMAVAASGTAGMQTVKLLTPAEMDEARGIETGYVPPGA